MIAADRILAQSQIYNFLRTVTIKNEWLVNAVNDMVFKKGYSVNEADPTSWKYYKNIIGLYHPSDTPMIVTSLDTRESLTLTPGFGSDHPKTYSAYSPGGIFYKKLCQTYPEQVDLIKSILFPVDNIQRAITAPNLSLLNWSTGYLEPAEEPILVAELIKTLTAIKERWYFEFLNDEPLWDITFWGCLWPQLGAALLAARDSNIQTPYVHSWDIWEALKGKNISNYSDILNRSKSMFLYQNIDYFKNNAGKQSNLIILANRLLSDFGIGLYGRKVVQERETGANQYQLTPQLVPVQLPTDGSDVTSEILTETIGAIQAQIYSQGLTSSEDADTVSAIERHLGDTTLNDFMTKFLEIRSAAKSKQYELLLNMFLVETLTLSIVKGYYTKAVEAIDPLSGAGLFFSPKELLALYNYAVARSVGQTPTVIPTQASFYLSFLTKIGTPDKSFRVGSDTVYVSSQIDAASYLSGLNYNTQIEHPIDFSNMLSRLWLRYLDHLITDQSTSLMDRRRILDYLNQFCHTRRRETFELIDGNPTYKDWLGPNGIDIYDAILAQYETVQNPNTAWGNLADAIMSVLVPVTDVLSFFGNFTLSNAGYDRLRQLFEDMCSYQVVFLDSDRNSAEPSAGGKWSIDQGPDFVSIEEKRIWIYWDNSYFKSVIDNDLPIRQHVDTIKTLDSSLSARIETNTVTRVGQQIDDVEDHVYRRTPQTVSVEGFSSSVTFRSRGYNSSPEPQLHG